MSAATLLEKNVCAAPGGAVTTAADVRRRIAAALHRNADFDAKHVDVAVNGTVVTLSGVVGSYVHYEAAANAAASTPGITEVDNRLQIGICGDVW